MFHEDNEKILELTLMNFLLKKMVKNYFVTPNSTTKGVLHRIKNFQDYKEDCFLKDFKIMTKEAIATVSKTRKEDSEVHSVKVSFLDSKRDFYYAH